MVIISLIYSYILMLYFPLIIKRDECEFMRVERKYDGKVNNDFK